MEEDRLLGCGGEAALAAPASTDFDFDSELAETSSRSSSASDSEELDESWRNRRETRVYLCPSFDVKSSYH